MSVLAGWAAGYIIGDRLPLAISRCNGGVWHPKYRLWNLILPGILLPIGLGIFGATLEYVFALVFCTLRCTFSMNLWVLYLLQLVGVILEPNSNNPQGIINTTCYLLFPNF